VTTYVIFQEFKHGDGPSTWKDLGIFDGADGKAAAKAAVDAMTPDDQAKAKTTKFRAAPASSFKELPTPNVTTETKVSFA